jgi:hypothetical protein
MRLRALLVLCLALPSVGAFAACDSGLAERMHAKLHPNRALDHERAVCQPWRAFPGKIIVVLPLPRPGSEPDHIEFDLDVLVVQQADNGNTERMTIASRVLEPKALVHDAMRLEEIRIDTARYRLNGEARAFGVRVRYQGSSRANPYANETLSLYVPQGARLAKVLDSVETRLQRGEWDTNCAGNFENVSATLSIAPTLSNGYADLMLQSTRVDSVKVAQGDECVTQDKPARVDATSLRYDGNAYQASKRIGAN